MANTAEKQNRIKNIVKLLLAVLVLLVLWAFINDSTYNTIKKPFVKNSDKYMEMYAYTKSKPSFTNKYFIVQGNDTAKSFFRDEVNTVSENDLDNIECSEGETLLIYEKPSDKISDFVKKKEGEVLALNKNTAIEFYVARISGSGESCNVGG